MHRVGTGDVGDGLAALVAIEGLAPLMRCQLRLAPEPNATLLGPLPSLARPRADQLALELGQSAEHRQHEATMSRRRVGPGVPERSKGGALFAQRIEDVQQVPACSGRGGPGG